MGMGRHNSRLGFAGLQMLLPWQAAHFAMCRLQQQASGLGIQEMLSDSEVLEHVSSKLACGTIVSLGESLLNKWME